MTKPSRPHKKRSEAETQRIIEASNNGHGPTTFSKIGRGLAAKSKETLSRKSDVDAIFIRYWKAQKKNRKRRGLTPMISMNMEIKSLLKRIFERENLKEGEYIEFCFGNGDMGSNIYGPKSAFEPYSGLAWYALEIERIYRNCREQIWLNQSERAAYHAFRMGMLFQEFEHMEGAGEFFDKAVAVKQTQKIAGAASQKVPIEKRQATYRKYRAMGDKKTYATENAARELKISASTIRNAFKGKLP